MAARDNLFLQKIVLCLKCPTLLVSLPERPAGSEGLEEEALAGLVSRDAMIGVARADTP